MITFAQIISEAQAQAEDDSAATTVLLKRAVNQGMRKFGALLRQDWRNRKQTFLTVASQTYYQTPEDCIRVKTITVNVGSVAYPLEEIVDEQMWQAVTMRTQTSSVPEYFFVEGNDQFGIWPTPSGVNTGTLTYEHSMRDMTQDDYITGTVTMTAGSSAVVGTGTTWTTSMVGRVLFVTDGSADGMGYKIASFTDSTHITLENTYGGTSGGTKTYLIGEVPDIPEEYHESLIDYALFRYYRRRRDVGAAKDMKASFDESLLDCKANYNSKTTSNYFRSPRLSSGYTHYRRDLQIP